MIGNKINKIGICLLCLITLPCQQNKQEETMSKKNLYKDLQGNSSYIPGKEIHQAILNIGYSEWQKEENKHWNYQRMIHWMEDTYGELAAYAILIGKLNYQVENGGFMQYLLNQYAGKHEHYLTQDERRDWKNDLGLHRKLCDLHECLGFSKSKLGKKVFEIIDNNLNYSDLDFLDSEYYKINDKWMAELEKDLLKRIEK